MAPAPLLPLALYLILGGRGGGGSGEGACKAGGGEARGRGLGEGGGEGAGRVAPLLGGLDHLKGEVEALLLEGRGVAVDALVVQACNYEKDGGKASPSKRAGFRRCR